MIIWPLIVGDILLQFFFRQLGWGSQNTGFSFGLGQNILPKFFYIFVSICLMLYLYFKRIRETGWWLIAGGGFANGFVRLFLGYVWDYLHWNLFFSLWFNLADVYIVMGVFLLLFVPLVKRPNA